MDWLRGRCGLSSTVKSSTARLGQGVSPDIRRAARVYAAQGVTR